MTCRLGASSARFDCNKDGVNFCENRRGFKFERSPVLLLIVDIENPEALGCVLTLLVANSANSGNS